MQCISKNKRDSPLKHDSNLFEGMYLKAEYGLKYKCLCLLASNRYKNEV